MQGSCSRGTRIRTRTNGFGDRYSTVKLYPCICTYILIVSRAHRARDRTFKTAAENTPFIDLGYGQALGRLVAVRCVRCRTCTPALSTSSSSRGLTSLKGMGGLVLGGASRLDAFSVYPVRTWLPSGALGGAAGTPAVRPSRSSRTEDSSPQASCARAG